jgi:3-oxoacyl-[acyl-carrier protein] reductase
MISLAGKGAVITGGSRGIGAATVRLLARAGADVVFSFHKNREAAQQVEQESRKHGTRVESFRADLRRMADAQALIEFGSERLGQVDILVANAGIWNAENAPIESLTERQWDEMMQVNLKSVYSVAHFVAPQMIARRSGRIIIISSTAGQRGEAFHSHYAATKGAVISFVKSLATELARHNVLVNCVAPGWVNTDMCKSTLESRSGRKFALAQIPLGRVATTEELAGPILFLASDLATFITGEILNVNGGSVLCG